MSAGYEVGSEGQWIKCLTCGLTSHNPNDVVHRYCGRCHNYHETPLKFLLVMRAADMRRIHPQTDWTYFCSLCSEPVGIYPSGQKVLRDDPTTQIICSHCRPPGVSVLAVPSGVPQELTESIPHPDL